MRSDTFWKNKYAFPLSASILSSILLFCLLQVFLVRFEFPHQLSYFTIYVWNSSFAEVVVNSTLKLEPEAILHGKLFCPDALARGRNKDGIHSLI